MARSKLKLDTARAKHPIQAVFFFLLFAGALVVVGYRIRGHFIKENFPGRVEGPEVHVSTVVRGRISQVAVQPNMRVEKGQVLVELQDETATKQIEAAKEDIEKLREAYEKAQREGPLFEQLFKVKQETATLDGEIEVLDIEIEKLTGEIESASVELQLLKDQLQRSEELVRERAMVLSEVESRRLVVLQKEQAIQSLSTELRLAESRRNAQLRLKEQYREYGESLREAWSKDLSGLEISIKEKEGELNVLLSERDQLIIKSPSGGIVSRLEMQAGETVQPGDEILRISTGEAIWVETYLNSQRVASIELGHQVFVHATGVNPIRLPGVVVGISPVMQSQPGYSPSPFEESTERIAIARVEFKDPQLAKQRVRPGQRVTVELLTREPKDKRFASDSN